MAEMPEILGLWLHATKTAHVFASAALKRDAAMFSGLPSDAMHGAVEIQRRGFFVTGWGHADNGSHVTFCCINKMSHDSAGISDHFALIFMLKRYSIHRKSAFPPRNPTTIGSF